jgi:hypothetical protein
MSNENLPATQMETTAVAKIDNGKPALYNPAAFDQIWRASKLFSSSDLVPAAYKGKPENCFIAIEMADRMGISPFAMLQSLVIIQGKPSMEAKLIIALVNDSGIFKDPLEYEIVGEDPHAQNYKVRCFATMTKSGKLCQGPWITYQMVKGEGWLDKGGSKWKTMPSIMFMYRAASFFAKVYCPNITMGMQTREEMEDVQMVNVTPARQEAPALLAPQTAEVVEGKTVMVQDTPSLVQPSSETVSVAATKIVDVKTGEITETPAHTPEPEKKKPGRLAKQQAEAVKPLTPKDDEESGFAPPPGERQTPVEPGPEPASEPETEPEEEMEDLF